MNQKKLLDILKKFPWETLHGMYGNSHSSIIGFISTGWIKSDSKHFVLDGAPSIVNDENVRSLADIILCKENTTLQIVVEVESGISKYAKKIINILEYLKVEKYKFGILIMLNGWKGNCIDLNGNPIECNGSAHTHNWDCLDKKIYKNKNILLISIEREEVTDNPCLKGHYKHRVKNIVCGVYNPSRKKEEKHSFFPK